MVKSPDAFRTISEVSEWLDTPAHVLRFWESKFSQVKPVKRAGGRRYYRPDDMLLLGGIKVLLHEDGMTIKGAQKLLREQGVRHVMSRSPMLGTEDDVIEAEAAPVAEVTPQADAAPVAQTPPVEETPTAEAPAPEATPDPVAEPVVEEVEPQAPANVSWPPAPAEPEPAPATPGLLSLLAAKDRQALRAKKDRIAPLVERLRATARG